VEGLEVKPEVELRSFLEDGREITSELNRLKINHFTFGETEGAIEEELKKIGALDEFSRPIWITKTKFYWSQTFPADKEIKIRHTYQPLPGDSWVTFRGNSKEKKWCIDKNIENRINELSKKNHEYYYEEYVSGKWIDYVLLTGANWAGPIGDFTLIVEKGDFDFVSTCKIPGLRLRRNGNGFIAKAKNFRPESDLRLLFLRPINWMLLKN
jgi:hypothetical protein